MRINAKTGEHIPIFPLHTSIPRSNEHTALSTPTHLLVPYTAQHVPTYHTWMQDPSIQAATASEPLTLEEEYAMQRSWRTDHDKLTFIICQPLDRSFTHGEPETLIPLPGYHFDAPDRMIGDINLFLFADEEEDNSGGDLSTTGVIGEIELMIPDPATQRQGYGRRSLITFMHYILIEWSSIAQEYSSGQDCKPKHTHPPKLEYLRAKINDSNVRSIRLFESVGFKKIGETANYFGEVELRWKGTVEDVEAVEWWQGASVLEYVGDD